MPLWAQSLRVEEVRPTFDVFGLGKTLYSMVSQKAHLRGWYHKDPEFDLTQMFPGDLGMEWINYILEKSVAERENQIRYKDAGEMLKDIERAISELGKGSSTSANFLDKRCTACGLGEYEGVCEVEIPLLPKDAKRPVYGILTCARCGHSDLFAFRQDENVPWKPKKKGFLFQKPTKVVRKPVVSKDRAKSQAPAEPEIMFHNNAYWRRNDPNPCCMNCKVKGGEYIPLKRSWKGFSCIKCGDDPGQIQSPDGWGIAPIRWLGSSPPKPQGDARKASDFDPHENA